MANQRLDGLVQWRGLRKIGLGPAPATRGRFAHILQPRLPLGRVAQFVHSPNDRQERLQRTLPDPIVIMRELSDQLDSAVLDVRQEVGTGGFKKSTEGVRGDLLLDTDHTVYFEQLVNINFFEGVNADCGCGGGSRRKGLGGTAFSVRSAPSH